MPSSQRCIPFWLKLTADILVKFLPLRQQVGKNLVTAIPSDWLYSVEIDIFTTNHFSAYSAKSPKKSQLFGWTFQKIFFNHHEPLIWRKLSTAIFFIFQYWNFQSNPEGTPVGPKNPLIFYLSIQKSSRQHFCSVIMLWRNFDYWTVIFYCFAFSHMKNRGVNYPENSAHLKNQRNLRNFEGFQTPYKKKWATSCSSWASSCYRKPQNEALRCYEAAKYF